MSSTTEECHWDGGPRAGSEGERMCSSFWRIVVRNSVGTAKHGHDVLNMRNALMTIARREDEVMEEEVWRLAVEFASSSSLQRICKITSPTEACTLLQLYGNACHPGACRPLRRRQCPMRRRVCSDILSRAYVNISHRCYSHAPRTTTSNRKRKRVAVKITKASLAQYKSEPLAEMKCQTNTRSSAAPKIRLSRCQRRGPFLFLPIGQKSTKPTNIIRYQTYLKSKSRRKASGPPGPSIEM